MKLDEFKGIERAIAKGPRKSKYYLYGDEEFIKQRLIMAIKNATVAPDFAEFNIDEFWGSDLGDIKPLYDALLAVPMMADSRLIILRGADGIRKFDSSPIAELDVPKGCTFVVEGNPQRKTTAFHKNLVKRFESHECSIRNDRERIEWSIEMAAERGMKLSSGAAKYLVERAGENLDTLAAELDKLAIVVDEEAPTKSDIQRLTSASRSANIFRFMDSFTKRDFKTALFLSQKLFDFGEPTIVMITLLKGELFKLLRLKVTPGNEAQLRVPPWKKEFYKNYMNRWSTEQLHNAIVTLATVDIGIKTGKLSQKEALIQAIAATATDK